ncbi:selenophosphate synthase [Roseovarius tolerans]|uniref:Selenophosphate synthase n=1 Tax=Roseovarius tolerans TaxID=74031 RepID=A0A1H8EHL7_9RHOB|nr:selenide, water dikinase SelD [Roseovarius tolerans]SEN18268.1 selenophosphate synthase [Roseovarius tolerans]
MMQSAAPLSRDLVLVGGGHAHALMLRMWGMDPLPGAQLTVIDPNPVAPYTGMLPGLVAGHYRREELEIDLVKLARFAGARLVVGAATRIDAEARRITVAGRGDISYDVASVDVGIHSGMPNLSGFAAHGVAAKPLGPFAQAWDGFVARVAEEAAAPQAAVIGGGIAGIELALAMAHRLQGAGARPEITLIERAAEIAPDAPVARARLLAALRGYGVQVLTGAEVRAISRSGVEMADGTPIPAGFVAGAAGARAHPWLAGSDLPVTDAGFLRVGPDLRVEGHETLFAAGDCAHLSHAPRPKAGVYAVRAAPVLRDNLRAALSGQALRAFLPQRHYLKLISLGRTSALAEKAGIAFAAPLLWRWKDRIDRKFMAKFDPLPEMPEPEAPRIAALNEETTQEPLCGGCGSKVAPEVLSGMLAAQGGAARPDILTGPGDDAAVLDLGGVRQVLTTDHLRGFTMDHGLMARVAALHALGDIWAMGACPQAALVSITLPRMSEVLQARRMSEIMEQAGDALRAAGAEIIGGHSTVGAELSIGFTVTGLLEGDAITTAGARPGDVLILTRPIGSGTLLAAEMRGQARGGDIRALWDVLATPQGDAAAILSDARAMTDVTGFGLAGHLWAICRASDCGAVLDPAAIPLFSGAEALAATGLRSTIWAANRRAALVTGAGEDARAALLHDPQTAGGFLAAVASDVAEDRLRALRAAGHDAAIIGQMEEGAPGVRLQGVAQP